MYQNQQRSAKQSVHWLGKSQKYLGVPNQEQQHHTEHKKNLQFIYEQQRRKEYQQRGYGREYEKQMNPYNYATKKEFRAPEPYIPTELQYYQDINNFYTHSERVWNNFMTIIGLGQDPYTQYDDESMNLSQCTKTSNTSTPNTPANYSTKVPPSTQFNILTLLACLYHVLMFFSIIAIQKYQFGRQLEIKKAFMKMSEKHSMRNSLLNTGLSTSYSTVMNSIMQMLQEQQDAFMQCTSTFDHGLIIGFATYHAVYAAYFMHGLVTWGANEAYQFKLITQCNKQQVFINRTADDVASSMKKLYMERTLNQESKCDMLCNIKSFLLLFGMMFCYYGIIQTHLLQQTCQNYTNISVIWTIFEAISFFIWVIVSFTTLWQYKMKNEQWFEQQIDQVLGPYMKQLNIESSKSMTNRSRSKSNNNSSQFMPNCKNLSEYRQTVTNKERSLNQSQQNMSQSGFSGGMKTGKQFIEDNEIPKRSYKPFKKAYVNMPSSVSHTSQQYINDDLSYPDVYEQKQVPHNHQQNNIFVKSKQKQAVKQLVNVPDEYNEENALLFSHAVRMSDNTSLDQQSIDTDNVMNMTFNQKMPFLSHTLNSNDSIILSASSNSSGSIRNSEADKHSDLNLSCNNFQAFQEIKQKTNQTVLLNQSKDSIENIIPPKIKKKKIKVQKLPLDQRQKQRRELSDSQVRLGSYYGNNGSAVVLTNQRLNGGNELI